MSLTTVDVYGVKRTDTLPLFEEFVIHGSQHRAFTQQSPCDQADHAQKLGSYHVDLAELALALRDVRAFACAISDKIGNWLPVNVQIAGRWYQVLDDPDLIARQVRRQLGSLERRARGTRAISAEAEERVAKRIAETTDADFPDIEIVT